MSLNTEMFHSFKLSACFVNPGVGERMKASGKNKTTDSGHDFSSRPFIECITERLKAVRYFYTLENIKTRIKVIKSKQRFYEFDRPRDSLKMRIVEAG